MLTARKLLQRSKSNERAIYIFFNQRKQINYLFNFHKNILLKNIMYICKIEDKQRFTCEIESECRHVSTRSSI